MVDNVDIPSPRRGWSSQGLPVVPSNDPAFWSVYDMTVVLGLTEDQVRSLIKLVGLQRVGKRHGGPRKRHVPVYRAREALDAYDKVAPVLGVLS